ncbi:ADP-ribosylation/crystallin J1 [Prosthecodimorpha staleyi]|uniref:ADP-ribosylation/crystallin J1 n=1 Tax=Prosthecodimorpha staleyi TaxID=2840188 RepID=UPI0021C37F6F|nr:ADP-ribosylation/crystallin J1 [Prosthecodimorpha staleyi]
MTPPAVATLFRPVGSVELRLIAEAGWRAFPPRLPDQPIFYPVTNLDYAVRIARDWNTKFGDRLGHVTRFSVLKRYLDRFETRIVGGAEHEEYWIPAEGLPEFNANIVGLIEVVASFTEADRIAAETG